MFRSLLPVLATLVLAVSGCDRSADRAESGTWKVDTGITISNARLVLPAVVGNPGAAYFDLANKTDRDIVLSGVTIDGAERAEMHETKGTSMAQIPEIAVPLGKQIRFAPGGRHVMVFGAPARSTAGETRTMTLTFKDGWRERVEAKLEAPGGDPMAGMDHGAMH